MSAEVKSGELRTTPSGGKLGFLLLMDCDITTWSTLKTDESKKTIKKSIKEVLATWFFCCHVLLPLLLQPPAPCPPWLHPGIFMVFLLAPSWQIHLLHPLSNISSICPSDVSKPCHPFHSCFTFELLNLVLSPHVVVKQGYKTSVHTKLFFQLLSLSLIFSFRVFSKTLLVIKICGIFGINIINYIFQVYFNRI